MLRTLLAAYLERTPAQLAFDRAPGGKPHMPGAPLRFNLSHVKGAVLVAVTRNAEVGVDLEDCGRRIDEAALAAACLSPLEARALDTLAHDRRKWPLLQQWTRKEAVLKAMGAGLAHDPCQLGLGLTPDTLRMAHVPYAGRNWKLSDIALGPDWAASLAVEGEPKAVRGFCLGW
jgi:4'-phosphopantetheinyl transferase